MASILAAVQPYVTAYATVLDYWVLTVTVLTLGYLFVRYPRFENKDVAATYIIFMSLFVFWAVRDIGNTIFQGGMPTYFSLFSLLLNIAVIVFSGYLFYHYERERDFQTVKERLNLEFETEEDYPEDLYDEGTATDFENLKQGYTYLVMEGGQAYAYKMFREAVTEIPGLCFSRTHPDKLRERHKLEETPIFWLTEREDTGEVDSLEPFRLNFMHELIHDFIEKNHGEGNGSVILIDGTEYLMYKNPFEKMMDFFEKVIDNITDQKDVTLIISIDADSLDDKKLALLREEFDEIRNVNEDGSIETRTF
ncbi:MAG: DUF835 domain-containing protein [Candidatus Nanohaloarchaeota archaeon QJJ-5]|nr:DUF835 domain-containing protein [Candidatus Nanohaloarchaeota archaeon QJJ-5]